MMTASHQSRFNIRVYGLLINEKQEVLLTDEYQLDRKMTKFPGGGMKYGEGTLDCLKREFREECRQEIEITDHFYTTDYFQPALFFEGMQLISIYYRVKIKGPLNFRISEKAFDFEKLTNGQQSFRWASITQLEQNDLSFPVDRLVLKMLQEQLNSH